MLIIKIRKKTVVEAKDRGAKAQRFNDNLRGIKKDFYPKHRGNLLVRDKPKTTQLIRKTKFILVYNYFSICLNKK